MSGQAILGILNGHSVPWICMDFEIIGEITRIETIASGSGVRDLPRLRKQYGKGRWRKRKGIAHVRLVDGAVRLAEIHWYEAHGIGKRELKLPLLTMKSQDPQTLQFALCLNNEGYPASLEVGKLYRVIPDEDAAAHGYIRLIDESGEDYAYTVDCFQCLSYPLLLGKHCWLFHGRELRLTIACYADPATGCGIMDFVALFTVPIARCSVTPQAAEAKRSCVQLPPVRPPKLPIYVQQLPMSCPARCL